MALNYSGGNLNDWTKLQNVGVGSVGGGPMTGSWVNQVSAAEPGLDYSNVDYNNINRINNMLTNEKLNSNTPTLPTGQQSGGSSVPSGNSGSGIPSVDMSFYQGWNDPNAIRMDWEQTWRSKTGSGGSGGGGVDDMTNRVRGEIESGYSNYFSELDNMMNSLTGQRTGQEQIVQNQFGQGVSDLDLQKSQGLSSLQGERESAVTNQSKNLKDLSENLRNMFMAGNVYLGSRGAGDSSAANQYSYALTKQGNKARGDVTSQTASIQAEINKRETALGETYNNAVNNLKTERDNKVIEVAQWFDNAQNQIRQAKASGQLQKSTDLTNLSKTLLENAINRLNTIDTEARSKQSALQEWAMNNSKTIGELKSNLANVSNYQANLPTAQQFSGTPTVDSRGNFNLANLQGWSTGNTEEKKNSLFGF